MSDPGLPVEILRQMQDALLRIERRFAAIAAPDDFLATMTVQTGLMRSA